MRTRPDPPALSPRGRARALLVVAAVALACSGTVRNPVAKDPLQDDVRAFLQARSQPWQPPAAGTPAAQAATDPLIEISGLVERPGALVIGPYARTVRDAIEALGATKRSDAIVRIRPAVDVAPALFAEAQQRGSSFEIPVASLATLAPVYVRPGDTIEVAAAADATPAPAPDAVASDAPAEAAPAAITTPAAVAAVETPAPATPEPAPTPGSVATGTESAAEATPPALPLAPASAPTPAAVAGPADPPTEGDLRKEIESLRRDMETRLAAVREELGRLRDENARLRGRTEPAARTTASAAAVAPPSAGAPPKRAADADSARAATSSESSSRSAERAPARARAADSVAEARPARAVRVTGSVSRPGAYPLSQVKTVREAIRAAGGGTNANLGAVEVRTEGHGGALVGIGLGLGGAGRTVVDVAAVDAGTGNDVELRGGEVIFVPAATRPGPPP